MVKKWSARFVAGILATAAGVSLAFPVKTITIIVPFAPGTTNDIGAREVAKVLSVVAKQAVVVENKVGAEGTIGTQAMINSPADGHTLMFASNSITVFDPLMKLNMPYDAGKDIVPVCGVGRTNLLINVNGSGPFKSVADVIAAAKANPGKLSFGYTSTSMRLAGEMFQQVSGVKLTGVPYKSSVTGLTELSSGLLDLIFIDGSSALSFHESGKVRPLAASGAQRLKSLPNVPSAAEAGVPGYSVLPWFGLYVSGKTPAAIRNQVSDIVDKVIKSPEMVANLEKRGLEPFNLCGDALVKFRQEEMETWRQVIQKAGIERQ